MEVSRGELLTCVIECAGEKKANVQNWIRAGTSSLIDKGREIIEKKEM